MLNTFIATAPGFAVADVNAPLGIGATAVTSPWGTYAGVSALGTHAGLYNSPFWGTGAYVAL